MKTNRFLLAVACATMAFTLFACSDDKDDPTGKACYATSPIELCMDLGKTITQADCDNGSKEDMKLTLRESCPPEPKVTCQKGGFDIYVYVDGFTCDMMD